MKRLSILSALAAALLLAVACQATKEDLTPEESAAVAAQEFPKTIKASLQPITRVSYAEEVGTHSLIQTWQVGDELIGLDDDENVIVMEVTDVDVNGDATLVVTDGALPASGSVHMMYAPGCYTGSTWPTALSLMSQTVASEGTVPAILTADAVVSGATVNLSFINRTAILGIKGFHGLPSNATVSTFYVEGVMSYASVALSAGTLAITPMVGMSWITLTKATTWTANSDGEVDDVFYVAAFPNASAETISIAAQLDDGSLYSNMLGSKTIAAARYYYMNDKALTKAVASVNGNLYNNIEDAFTAANGSSQWGTTIRLMADCTASADLTVTNTTTAVQLDLNGHELSLDGHKIEVATAGVEFSLMDMTGGGSITQETNGAPLLDVSDGEVYIDVELSSNNDSPVLQLRGNGEVDIYDNAVLSQAYASAFLMNVYGSSVLNIVGGTFNHTLASGWQTLYVHDGSPSVEITGGTFYTSHTSNPPIAITAADEVIVSDEATFIHTGSQPLFRIIMTANSNKVQIKGGYFKTSNCFKSDNAGGGTISGGYYTSSGPTRTNMTTKANHSFRQIYPSVIKEGETFTYRLLLSNIQTHAFSIASGETVYPAMRNVIYTPSTSTWGLQTSGYGHEGYTSGYNADQVNLFTWGLGSWSTDPAGTEGLTGLGSGAILGETEDWGYAMPADNLFSLTKEEWNYLLFERPASTVNGVENARFMKCTIQDSKGLLIFPDKFTWNASAGSETTATAVNNPNADFSITYSRTPSGYLTGSNYGGCIFLRADGRRDGTNSVNAGTYGYYWTATHSGYSGGNYWPWALYFNSSTLNISNSAVMVSDGAAVRLFSR